MISFATSFVFLAFLTVLVSAVDTDGPAEVFAALAVLPAILALYAALNEEWTLDDFQAMATEHWSKEAIEQHLDDVGAEPKSKTRAYMRSRLWHLMIIT